MAAEIRLTEVLNLAMRVLVRSFKAFSARLATVSLLKALVLPFDLTVLHSFLTLAMKTLHKLEGTRHSHSSNHPLENQYLDF
jgi:hypothetical protein